MGRSQAPGVRVEPLCGRKSALTGYVWAMLEIPRNRLGLWAVSVFPVSGSSIPDLPVSWLLNSELFVALGRKVRCRAAQEHRAAQEQRLGRWKVLNVLLA